VPDPSARRLRPYAARALLIVGVVAMAVLVAGVLVVRARDDGPPPVASGAGVFRVHPQYQANGGLRTPEELSYRGTTFRVAFGGAVGSGDATRAGLTVTGPRGTLARYEEYPVGARIRLDGAALEVRAVYAGRSDRDDVVDLQVVPAAG
jgi:hypothetical protein